MLRQMLNQKEARKQLPKELEQVKSAWHYKRNGWPKKLEQVKSAWHYKRNGWPKNVGKSRVLCTIKGTVR